MQNSIRRTLGGTEIEPGAVWTYPDVLSLGMQIRCESVGPDVFRGVVLIGNDEVAQTDDEASHEDAKRAGRALIVRAFQGLFA